MKKLIILVSSLVFILGCSDKKNTAKDTTPEKQTEVVENKNDLPKAVPAEKAYEVQKIWEGGLAAVTECIGKRIAQTNQKGLSGYIIVEGTIGTSENPKNLRIVDKKLAVDKIEDCIMSYLKGLQFPTWGYEVKYQHPYNISILY
ncbi:hypothetical protein KKF34_06495 [Myxococcota bacterium]|nr:hypothetical protein [Myxococcota bacterium]MBU1381666.1 hypothetical protein [Myxococcota bacterium]MBU1496509.1 hypothetical protein [Myxococcota bacterium]